MTKRNKKTPTLIKVVLNDSPTCEGVIPIIINKCNCGADVVEGSIGCIRFPECCDDDLVLVELPDYEGVEFI